VVEACDIGVARVRLGVGESGLQCTSGGRKGIYRAVGSSGAPRVVSLAWVVVSGSMG
jgi:hypothetical protein